MEHQDLILKTIMMSTGEEEGLDDFMRLQEIADSLMRSIDSFISSILLNLRNHYIINSVLTDLRNFLFGEFSDYSISINGYDEPGEWKFPNVSNRTVYNSIAIESTQGDIYNLDDYFQSCVCRWEKVK
jgi:hypothetical protein